MIRISPFTKSSLIFFLVWPAVGVAQKRMIPHLTSATGGFNSQVALSNPTPQTRTYRLQGYTQAGEMAAMIEGQLEPFQTAIHGADQLFGMNLSHFEIVDSESVAVSVIYQRNGPDAGLAHVHETSLQTDSWRILPGNEAVTWDGLAAVNTGSAATYIRVAQIDAAGQTVAGPHMVQTAVPPNAKVLYLFSQHFESIAGSSFEIDADQPIALVALRGNHASDFLWENKAVPLDPPALPENRFIAHVTSSIGGFRSQTIVSNPTDTERTFSFIGYDSAGNMAASAEGTVAAGHTLVQDTHALFGMEISHFDIADESQVLVSIAYERNSEISGPAQVQAQSQAGNSWRIYPGNPAVTWDGLAAVNRGAAPSDAVAWQMDANGSLIRGPITILSQLAPKAKGLYVFATHFTSEPGAYYEITATEPLAVVALRGNQASDFLWENSALPLPDLGPAPQPPARIDYAFAFDPARRVSIMVGGYDHDFDLLEDTWLWNGRRWRQVETETSPVPRAHHGGAFDPLLGQMIIFGGVVGPLQSRNDFRAFDGVNWQEFPGDPAIPAQDGELVFDSGRGLLVLTVPSGNVLQTWEFQNGSWQRRMTATDPGRRLDQGLAYDANRQRTVLFGGLGIGNQATNQTWEYDGQNWIQAIPVMSPPALIGTAMFFDSVRGRIVMFGGMDADFEVTNETWTYDGATWTRLDTPTAPSARWVAFASFDPKRGVATLFGGEGEGDSGLILFDDTWEFDGTTWTKR